MEVLMFHEDLEEKRGTDEATTKLKPNIAIKNGRAGTHAFKKT